MRYLFAFLIPYFLAFAENKYKDPISKLSFSYPDFLITQDKAENIELIASSTSGFPNLNLLKIHRVYDLEQDLKKQIANVIEDYESLGMNPSILEYKLNKDHFAIDLANQALFHRVYFLPNCRSHLVMTITYKNSKDPYVELIKETFSRTYQAARCKENLTKPQETSKTRQSIILGSILIIFSFILYYIRKLKA